MTVIRPMCGIWMHLSAKYFFEPLHPFGPAAGIACIGLYILSGDR